jgi:hypothetical protein
MIVDEAALPGGTLVNAAISFSIGPAIEAPSQPPGLLSFDIFPWPATVFAWLDFTTDADRRIVSWNGGFLDGPPDGYISTQFDYHYPLASGWAPDTEYRSASPGRWIIISPAPIPLPPALALLLTGLAALGIAARPRRA